jgi:hypothetical protein
LRRADLSDWRPGGHGHQVREDRRNRYEEGTRGEGQRNVKRWRDGDMRKRWTAAGMLVAEQQFRRIIGYRDLAKLVIAIERHAIPAAPKNPDHQEIAESVTV